MSEKTPSYYDSVKRLSNKWKMLFAVVTLAFLGKELQSVSAEDTQPPEPIDASQVNPYIMPMNEDWLAQQGSELPEGYKIEQETLIVPGQRSNDVGEYEALVFDVPETSPNERLVTTITLKELPPEGSSFEFQLGELGKYSASGGKEGSVIWVTFWKDLAFIETIRVDMINDEDRRTSDMSMNLSHLGGGPYQLKFVLQEFPGKNKRQLQIYTKDNSPNAQYILLQYTDIPNGVGVLEDEIQVSVAALSNVDVPVWNAEVLSIEIDTELREGLEANSSPVATQVPAVSAHPPEQPAFPQTLPSGNSSPTSAQPTQTWNPNGRG